MLFGIGSLAGCSNSDTAAHKEEYSQKKYEWEKLFSTEEDKPEVLTIYRRHSENLIFHNTYFKVVVYKDGVCTHFYESTAVSSKKIFISRSDEEQIANLKDGCEVDGVLAALYPHIETVYANRIMENVINGEYSGEEMATELFINNMKDYFDTYNLDIVTETCSSGLGIMTGYNDYAAKIVEIAISVDEANKHFKSTSDAEDIEDYARITMPWLSKIEMGTKTSLNIIYYANAKALMMLDSLTARYASGKIDSNNYKEEFEAVENELIENFKTAMDDIDAQVEAQVEEKAEKFEEWWEDFCSF